MKKTVNRCTRLRDIPIEFIEPTKNQARTSFDDNDLDELCSSIKEVGLIQPLTVRYRGGGAYELIAGERRLRAAKKLEMKYIPCLITDADDEESALMTLIENIQRKDLDFFEEAVGIAFLIKNLGITQTEAAEKIGKSQSAVANKLRLLRLPSSVREYISQNNLTERHARALLTLDNEKTMLYALKYTEDKSKGVEQFEKYIQFLCSKGNRKNKKPSVRGFCRDIRLYVNTISKAVKMMQSSGINASLEHESDSEKTVYKITIRQASP